MGNKSVGYLNIVFGASTKSFEKSLKNLQRSVKRVGVNLKNTGRNLTRNLTVPIIGMGAIAVKTFADFEQSMLKVKAVSGATGAEFQSLENNAKHLGKTTMFTASQVAGLQLELAKLGFSTVDINNSTQAILQLSQATGHDLAESGEIVAATLNSFNMETKDATKVADIFAVASSNAAIDMEKLSVAMPTVGATASAVGVPLEDLTAMMMTLADRGMEASTMGTHLRKIFVELATKGISLDEAMLQINSSTNKVKTATELFGKRAFAAGIILSDNTDTTQKYGEAIDKAAGKSKEMSDIMDSGTLGAMRRLKSQTEGLAIDLGEKLIPVFEGLMNFITNTLKFWDDLDDKLKNQIITIGLIAAAVGPIVTAFGFLVTTVAALISPIGLAVIAIGALVAAFIFVEHNFESFKERLSDWSWWKNSLIEAAQSMVLILGGPLTKALGITDAVLNLKKDTKVFKTEFSTFGEALTAQTDKLKEKLKGNLVFDFVMGNPFKLPTMPSGTTSGGGGEITVNGNSSDNTSGNLVEDTLKTTKSMSEIWTDFWSNWGKNIASTIDKASMILSGLGTLSSSISKKETIQFENERNEKNKALDEDYQKQLTLIENSILNEEGKQSAIANLDASFSDKKLALDKNMAKKEATIKRKQAVRDKMLGIANATISGVEAVMAAIAASPLTGGLPWSAIVGGLAAANVATIASTPIPTFADGGIVSGPTLGLMGEYGGAKGNPEVVAPLDKLKSLMGNAQQKVEVYGRISGNDLIILNQKAEFNRNRFV
mgnify:CR=1 FL=1|tara:strand:- start:2514 stop:4835 length:2322 start_codon:yes stop_codon:yes gene_type:complete